MGARVIAELEGRRIVRVCHAGNANGTRLHYEQKDGEAADGTPRWNHIASCLDREPWNKAEEHDENDRSDADMFALMRQISASVPITDEERKAK